MMRGPEKGFLPAKRQLIPRLVIAPDSGAIDWLDLWRFRDLFAILAERDIRLRYRQTALGIFWVILQPLAASLIFAAIFGSFAKLPSGGAPYVLFVFAAMLPWNLFSAGVQRGGNSLINNVGLVTKIYFPRAIIPIATVAAVLLDFAVASVLMVVLLFAHAAPFSPSLLAIPLLTILVLGVTVGVSLLVSALNVYYRDFSNALPFILQIWLYGSPIVYSSTLVPDRWRLLYGLNPLVGIVDGFRWALLGAPMPTVTLIESAVITVVAIIVGAAVFKRVERSFADVI